jgi:hypothetical protein
MEIWSCDASIEAAEASIDRPVKPAVMVRGENFICKGGNILVAGRFGDPAR